MAGVTKPTRGQIFEKVRNNICDFTSSWDFPVKQDQVTLEARFIEDMHFLRRGLFDMLRGIVGNSEFDDKFGKMKQIHIVEDVVNHISVHS